MSADSGREVKEVRGRWGMHEGGTARRAQNGTLGTVGCAPSKFALADPG